MLLLDNLDVLVEYYVEVTKKSLIPLYLMMFITESKVDERKLRAANFLFLYTLLGSLAMLLAFIYIILNVGTGSFQVLEYIQFSYNTQIFL